MVSTQKQIQIKKRGQKENKRRHINIDIRGQSKTPLKSNI